MPGVKVLIKGLNKVIDFPVGSKMDDIGKHIQGNWSSVEEMSGLPMDKASRMERAKYMGFDVDNKMFHGTDADFSEFAGRTDRKGNKKAVFITPSSNVANKFANNGMDVDGANVLPVMTNVQNTFDFANKDHLKQLEGRLSKERIQQIADGEWQAIEKLETEKALKDLGFDSFKVMEGGRREAFSNSDRAVSAFPDTSEGKEKAKMFFDQKKQEWDELSGGASKLKPTLEKTKDGFTISHQGTTFNKLGEEAEIRGTVNIGVFDPKNIRSVNAAFDPSKKDSANLLAGVGAAAVGVSAMSPEEAEAGTLGKAGKSIAKEMKRLHPNIKSFITEDDGVVTLQKVIVDKESRGAGEGTKFMEDFLRLADEKGSKAALTPTSDFGGNKKRLEGFYERFGFTPNKGKAKDFSISESLVREPKALAAAGITALSTEQAQARQQAQKSFIESMLSDQSLESLPSFTNATAPSIDQMKLPQQYRADVGGFQAPGKAVPSVIHQAGGLLKKFDTPILGNPVEGLADYMINFGYDDSAKERAKRAASAGLDLI